MTMPKYGPVDAAVKTWLLTTTVAPLANQSVFLAMPKSSPLPALLVTLIAGGPTEGADIPVCRYRLSFDCMGKTRDQAMTIALELVSVLQGLGVYDVGVAASGVYLASANILNFRWQPDPNSDTARYIVDALIATVT